MAGAHKADPEPRSALGTLLLTLIGGTGAGAGLAALGVWQASTLLALAGAGLALVCAVLFVTLAVLSGNADEN